MPHTPALRVVSAAAILASAGAAAPAAVEAQQALEGQVGRFYEDGGWTLFRLGLRRPGPGPFAIGVHGTYLTREGDQDGAFAGVGTDLTLFRGGAPGPYLVAGVSGGVGSPNGRSFSSFWGSWSAGAGFELLPAPFLAFNAEARWREVSLDRRDGLELAAGLSFRLGAPAGRLPRATPPPPAEYASPMSRRDSVVAAALDAMGRPYRLGGTGEDGGGFDCSGLIQHAYARHGVSLPRTSAEQAEEGRKVSKRLESLAPGDLLTFSSSRGQVTHVGMYLGDGRFVHSATRGVQVSLLSEEDPYGRWWYRRWVGARRILEEDGAPVSN